MFLVASRLGHSIETRVDDEAATKRRIALAKLFDQVAMEMVDRVVLEAVRASTFFGLRGSAARRYGERIRALLPAALDVLTEPTAAARDHKLDDLVSSVRKISEEHHVPRIIERGLVSIAFGAARHLVRERAASTDFTADDLEQQSARPGPVRLAHVGPHRVTEPVLRRDDGMRRRARVDANHLMQPRVVLRVGRRDAQLAEARLVAGRADGYVRRQPRTDRIRQLVATRFIGVRRGELALLTDADERMRNRRSVVVGDVAGHRHRERRQPSEPEHGAPGPLDRLEGRREDDQDDGDRNEREPAAATGGGGVLLSVDDLRHSWTLSANSAARSQARGPRRTWR